MNQSKSSSTTPPPSSGSAKLDEARKVVPGAPRCKNCMHNRMHISKRGTRGLSFLMRPFLVVFRCYSCGRLVKSFRPFYWYRRLFRSAGLASQPAKSTASNEGSGKPKTVFEAAKRDEGPVRRYQAMQETTLGSVTNQEFDLQAIVNEVRAKYTLEQRDLIASRFHALSDAIGTKSEPSEGVTLQSVPPSED